ncbi:FAD:protein FMN transferase [Pseudomonas corrugata]
MKTSTELQRYSLSGETMGTRYTALFYAGAGIDSDEVGRHLACAVARVDQQMSTWKPDSDLNRLNAAPEQQWVAVPRELATVLSAALRISQQSAGAFDIAVGDLVDAWGSAPENRQSQNRRSRRCRRTPGCQPAPRWWLTLYAIRCANARRCTLI